jgi:predicted PurR-regulated permease PerM
MLTFIFRNPVFWVLGVFTSLLTIVWCFSQVLTPYIFGVILAYLLDPLVDKLENFGFPRTLSSIVIMLLALSIISACLLLLFPALIAQTESLLMSFPDIYSHGLRIFESLIPDFVRRGFISADGLTDLKSVLSTNGINIATKLASYALVAFDLLVLFLIVPVITFYLLMDWDKILSNFSGYLPKRASKQICDIILNIDNVLSGFIRGQLLICLMLSLLYSVSLLALGLNYSLLIGLFAGLISFIPFLGASVGAVIALSVAALQFWNAPEMIAYVGMVFIVGQLFESNFLTPRLIGNSVRLHPVMIMLAVSIGGALSGLSGVMLAVPVAAIIAVLFREILRQYLTSTFFQGS